MNTEGKRRRDRPKSTWRWTAEAELHALNLNWEQATRQDGGVLLMPYAPDGV